MDADHRGPNLSPLGIWICRLPTGKSDAFVHPLSSAVDARPADAHTGNSSAQIAPEALFGAGLFPAVVQAPFLPGREHVIRRALQTGRDDAVLLDERPDRRAELFQLVNGVLGAGVPAGGNSRASGSGDSRHGPSSESRAIR